MKKTITIQRYDHWTKPPRETGTRQEIWEPLPDMFCPYCGNKEVWHETGPGDYYVDESHMCRACGSVFYLPGGIRPASTNPLDTDNQILTQLRTK